MGSNTKNEQPLKPIEITVYADPLCCWSWAFEPQLQQLVQQLGDQAVWHYRMGGFLPSWRSFHDSINAVTRPAQMGPVWMHAAQLAARSIRHDVWIKDPPTSSYPACMAVKCAQLQHESLGAAMLHLFWQACMGSGINISQEEAILDVARQLSKEEPAFDFDQFVNDYEKGNGKEAFRADLQMVSYHRINRFPSLVIKAPGQRAVLLSGYRTCTSLMDTIGSLLPDHNEAMA